jgi:hypothetical protein
VYLSPAGLILPLRSLLVKVRAGQESGAKKSTATGGRRVRTTSGINAQASGPQASEDPDLRVRGLKEPVL